jgi:predicted RNase H-like nuclease
VDIPLAIGVDGASGGWMTAADYGDRTEVRLVPDLSHVVALTGDGACPAAIDVPIGLPDDVRFRRCDRAARSRLGARQHSVFMPPGRFLLGSCSFEEVQWKVAQRRQIDPTTKGLSRQAFGLLEKITEVDAFARSNPASEHWLVEIHPEVCFAVMNQDQPLPPKATAWGRTARVLMVGAAFTDLSAALERAVLANSLFEDALDAYAALWTASRLAQSKAITLGGERDSQGLPMRMVA